MAERTSAGLVDQFVNVTGASKKVARSMLEACNGNLEMAIEMHLDSCEGSQTEPRSSNSVNSSSQPGNLTAGPSSNFDPSEDDVRAPIPQTRGILVEPYQAYPTRKRQSKSVFDAFRDFQAEARQQEGGAHQAVQRGKKKTLHDLFRPPIDLLHKGTFDTAKLDGQDHSKWLLVNVQDVREFPCQQLNRDVWSNEAVRTIIRESFVLWQVYRDSNEGERFIQFYHVTSYPYLAVLDPRTGEKLVEWGFMDAQAFCECASEFLLQHPSLERETPPAKKRRSESIVDASEDSQLRAAIAASMTYTTCANREREDSSGDDDDDDDDLEFSESDSEEEEEEEKCKTPQKNTTRACNVVRTEAKREIHFDTEASVSVDKKKRTHDNIGVNVQEAAPSENLNGTGSKKERNKPASPVRTNNRADNRAETNKVDNDEAGSKASGKYDTATECLGERTQEQAGPLCNIMVRFPNGSRTHLSLSAEAPLKELVLLVQKEGFPNERFELVTNFPRKRLSCLDFGTTLKSAGLFPQETVFVQER